MCRILIKGGVWRNTEDEILKAGVMKYGKNQWSRIASLLHRKTAKQCKARWQEWLDPSIKKTEWSREEEEKLLHLAKLMPTQWRTISTMVGRTPAQCLEHYNYLLDQANKQPDDEQLDDPRKLKPGELDPNPETKPARPDPKDMDEDELEMLSEARARLANTQGKKAKRKAREKQLEEARRLAALQKRRELRQAGIYLSKNPKGSKRKKGIDYNAEIPLQKAVPDGPYDTSNDVYEPAHFNFKKLRQQHLDEEGKYEREEKERKKDKQMQKDRKENDQPPINFNFVEPIKKRSKLVLPEPQISETELEQVVKIGKMNSNVLAEIDDDQAASHALLSDYSITSNSALNELRTPRQSTYSRESLIAEAQNLMALTNTETPLKGGENTPLVEVAGFTSGELATPGYKTSTVSATPNLVLSTPFRTPGTLQKAAAQATPSGSFTPASVRDNLNINPEESLALQISNQKNLLKENRTRLKQFLSELPAPKNEYEIVVNDDLDESAANEEASIEMDQSDADQNLQKSINDDLDSLRRKQTLAVQRRLPRPQEIVKELILQMPPPGKELTELHKSDMLIKEEMLNLLNYDLYKNPTEKQLIAMGSRKSEPVQLERVSEQDLRKAKELLDEEIEIIKASAAKELSLDEYSDAWEECWSQLCYVENDKRYRFLNSMERKAKVESLSYLFAKNKEHMNREAKKAFKLEKKLKTLLGGYQSRSQSLQSQLVQESNELEQAVIELNTFKMLKGLEEGAIAKRVGAVTADVRRQIAREKSLQKKFDDLKREKEERYSNGNAEEDN